ncbi:4'-phosphopantetheinyl transferase superfamily protein [Bremerella volcania]|uniref:4'-phosphopantetheinyl transferase superfamily protein n=1 Tax=Bremerella volcania TaxID=2527984 RepID=A0A518CAV1_9BACT|nr:4'-phosphopantetheinyl transferase family protein [Bremerella volcania]QDU76347.1 4'-phosphopantetheinyl transferase superfamily protein [Bremerella volcania]
MISTYPRIVRYVSNSEKLGILPAQSWLTDLELSELSYWKDSSRRNQWLAGRWLAKRLVTRSLNVDLLREVEILSRGKDGLGKSPTITVGGISISCRLSISHSNQAILVGMTSSDARIGVDVASGVPLTPGFRSRWFNDKEVKWIETNTPIRLPVAWALKESIFKACGNERKWDPRSVELVAIDKNRVHSRIHGVDVAPLTMWVRTTRSGAATAVWSDTANQEVTLCS